VPQIAAPFQQPALSLPAQGFQNLDVHQLL